MTHAKPIWTLFHFLLLPVACLGVNSAGRRPAMAPPPFRAIVSPAHGVLCLVLLAGDQLFAMDGPARRLLRAACSPRICLHLARSTSHRVSGILYSAFLCRPFCDWVNSEN